MCINTFMSSGLNSVSFRLFKWQQFNLYNCIRLNPSIGFSENRFSRYQYGLNYWNKKKIKTHKKKTALWWSTRRRFTAVTRHFILVLLNYPDMSCTDQLPTDLDLHCLPLRIWICINNWIKNSDWLKIRNGRGILIYSAWQGLTPDAVTSKPNR